MTYKNFALDHFLESCLKYTKNIVRIGKAGNENLAGINLRNVRRILSLNEFFKEICVYYVQGYPKRVLRYRCIVLSSIGR